jgi:DNA-binding NarL/FixJ family response regulator
MSTIRVLIVDDHAVVADGLERVLQADPRIRVVGSARTLKETLGFLRQMTPEAIVLDLRLPDSRDYSTIASVHAACPEAAVIVLTGVVGIDPAEARKRGASAVLDKHTSATTVLQAVRSLFPLHSEPVRKQDQLTARERDVARLAADGMTNAEIAKALYVSENTVKTHLATILRKLRIRRRVDLVRVWATPRPGR